MGKETCNLQPGYYGTSCDFQDIKNAVTILSNKSEAQFEEIKNEKWYKRLFNIVTCSKKNNIRMAEQITSLTQAQEILVEILVRLADEDNQIAKLVMQSQNDIYQLAQASEYLQDRLYLLEDKCLGIKEYENLKGLDQQQRMILSACLHQACSLYEEPSEEQRFYANEVLTYLGTEASVDNLEEALDAMDDAAKRKIFSCVITYMYLYDHTEATLEQEPRQNFVDLFDLGRKTVKSIKQQVVDIHRLRGVKGCVGRCLITPEDITESTPFEVEIENAEDNEDITTDESNYSEDWEIDTSIEREYLNISGIIPVTAKKVYENKDIHFSSAIIECSGELEFRNCTIHYNEDNGSHINLKEDASLSILGCTVICHADSLRAFITTGVSECKASIRQSTFVDCVDFINGYFISFCFSDNKCIDCCMEFLYVGISENGESKVLDSDFVFATEPVFKPISGKTHSSSFCIYINCHTGKSDIVIGRCNITAVPRRDGALRNYLEHVPFINLSYNIFASNSEIESIPVVAYCTFKNMMNCIEGGAFIQGCIFENCQDVLNARHSMWSAPYIIQENSFINCEHVARELSQGSQITNCWFYGSTQGEYISSAYGASVTIETCEFVNLSITKKERFREAIILLKACSKSELRKNGVTKISKCIFNGIQLAEEISDYGIKTPLFLIAVSFGQDPVKSPLVSVSGCIFKNCATSNSSKEIIRQQHSHYGLFNRESRFETIDVYNCPGYDEVTDLAHYVAPSDCKPRLTDNEGDALGSQRPEINLFAEDIVTVKLQMV